MYARFFKRIIDFIVALFALVVLSPLLLIMTIVGALVMKGNPFFVQLRPGCRKSRKNADGSVTYGSEKIFKLIKFRSMTNAKDKKTGELLPDDKRLTRYGKFLRSSSLDELPELAMVLIGTMSLVGPRPQLVKDMVFMTDEQRTRHNVKPGITGLAQVNGRNAIRWEDKLEFDIKYVKDISFKNDLRILFQTVMVVLKRSGINEEGMETAEDFGDYLLKKGEIDKAYYHEKVELAKEIVKRGAVSD